MSVQICEHMFDMKAGTKAAKVTTLAEASGTARPERSTSPQSDVAEAIRASTEADLEDALHQFHGIHCLAHIQLLRVVVEKERRGELRRDGVRSGAEWLSLKLGLSSQVGREWATVAQKLDALPRLSEAYERGEICWDSVRHLVKFATPETEHELVDWAKHAPADTMRIAANRHRAARQIGEASYEDCYVRLSKEGGNAPWRLSGLLTAEQGSTVKAALERLSEEPQKTEHDDRTWGQRYADALTELAGAQLANDQDPDRATVVLHVDVDTLKTREGVADFEDGASVPAEVARRIACDCRLQVSIDTHDGRSVGLGRTSRNPNASLLRYLRSRDKGCRFPSCGRTRFLRSHHIDHWVDEGPTDPDNLVLLCGFHHKLVHEDGWSVRGNPEGRLRFVRPDGRKLMMGPLELRPIYRERLFRNSGPLAPVW
jgi:hypothetical protein